MKNKFESIQLLRFVAASMVAVTHITFFLQTRVNPEVAIWKIGSQGVQIFFVISGFVMVLASGSLTKTPINWRDFIVQRLIRIAPVYWVLNLVKLTTLLIIPTALFAAPDFWNIFFSLIFIPSKNANGVVETFYGPGWTLNFEMLFYGIITIALFFHRNIFYLSFAILAPLAVLSLFRSDSWVGIMYFCHPYLLNFLWGMFLAYLFNSAKISPAISSAALLVGAYIVFLSPPSNTMAWGGLQYFLLVAGVIGLEPVIEGKVPRILIFGGDSSYSLYLTHAITGVAAAYIIAMSGIESIPVALMMMFAFVFVASSIFYLAVEKPLTIYLKLKYKKSQCAGKR